MKKQRQYLTQDFKISTWELLKPYFDQLLEQPINNMEEFN